ncbi:MAG: MGMT family protein [Candidatus Woykebacteria bacterium]
MLNQEGLYAIVAKIPKGKVSTYGALARLSGIKNARMVGGLLHKNPDPHKIPCHRVVNAKGKLAANYAFGGSEKQAEKLFLEGVQVSSGKIDLQLFLWRP